MKWKQKVEGAFLSIQEMIPKGRGEGQSEENACHQLREPDRCDLWYYLKYV